jgi:hypothetical protein
VLPHGVRVGARAVGHGHGRDQAAARGTTGKRTFRRCRGGGRVGAVEADTLAELQGRRGRRRGGAREAGVAAAAVQSTYYRIYYDVAVQIAALLATGLAASEKARREERIAIASECLVASSRVCRQCWWQLKGTRAKRCPSMSTFSSLNKVSLFLCFRSRI